MFELQEERIRVRAYELWLQGGCQEGLHDQNWARAEAQLHDEDRRRGDGDLSVPLVQRSS
jgi:Protein of unknown function (DUF2934)